MLAEPARTRKSTPGEGAAKTSECYYYQGALKHDARWKAMKKNREKHGTNGGLRREYDFSEGKDAVRGKYANRYRQGTNTIRPMKMRVSEKD